MLKKMAAAAAATMMAASPCLATDLPRFAEDPGARQTGGVAALYYKVPLGGSKAKSPRAGLRLSMVHDYRTSSAPTARVLQSEGLELRLLGPAEPTLYLGGRPVTGEEAKKLKAEEKKQNFSTVGTVVTLAILAGAAVGVYFLARAIDDSGGE